MPNELREKWSEVLVEKSLFNDVEHNNQTLNFSLNLDGTIEIMNDSSISDPEIGSVHYHSLAEIISALDAHQQQEDRSAHTSAPFSALHNFVRADSLYALAQATVMNNMAGFHAAFGTLSYRCIHFATSLRVFSRFPFLHE